MNRGYRSELQGGASGGKPASAEIRDGRARERLVTVGHKPSNSILSRASGTMTRHSGTNEVSQNQASQCVSSKYELHWILHYPTTYT